MVGWSAPPATTLVPPFYLCYLSFQSRYRFKESNMNSQKKLKIYRLGFGAVVVLIISYAIIKAIEGKEEFAGVIVAVFIGLAGLMQDSIKSLFYRPALRTVYQPGTPYGHKVASRSATGTFICDNYYFRIKVENIGNESMQDIEIITDDCQKETASGIYQKVEDFLPLNLSWSHKPTISTIPFIRDGSYLFCSFGFIRKSEQANLSQFRLLESFLFLIQSGIPILASISLFPVIIKSVLS
jgi:hypothetical protein